MSLFDLKEGDIKFLNPSCFIRRTKDGFVNENNDILNFNKNVFTPVVVKNFFKKEDHQRIKHHIYNDLNTSMRSVDTDNFHRTFYHNEFMMRTIHPQLTADACNIFGEEVKPSYSFLSMYNEKGICPFHTDRPQCKYTIDFCIDQDQVWPINIQDQDYILEPNDAVCYSGTDSPHYREKIKGKFCNLVFFHFVPVSYDIDLN